MVYQLTITRQFSMPVERLFNAWTNPVLVRQWFAPGNLTVPQADIDFKLGGQFQIVMFDGDTNTTHTVHGEYLEIQAYQCIRFSWQWLDNPNISQVTLSFRSIDANASELTLTHTEFNSDKERDSHQRGWDSCLIHLDHLDL